MTKQNTQQYVNLTDAEIQLFNEIFSNENYYFKIDSHRDIRPNIALLVFNDNNQIDFNKFSPSNYQNDYIQNKQKHPILILFNKFKSNDPNILHNSSTSWYKNHEAIYCEVSKSITHKFPENRDTQLDKNDLFDLFKEMIDPSQYSQLLKKQDIKMLEIKDGNNNMIPPLKATQKGPSSCFNLSSITEFFKKIINFISCGLLCNDKEKTKTN